MDAKKFLPLSFFVVFLIFVGFILIVFSINFFSSNKEGLSTKNILLEGVFFEGEHYRGARDAPVVVVEYGEVECPYCKDFHYVMKRILGEYEGQIAWIYRHFPIASHPKSVPEALALECVAELRGEDGFWEYLDILFRTTPSNNKMDLSLLAPLAVGLGVPQAGFEECLSTERHKARIQDDRNSGILWGVNKVPHVIIIAVKNGKEFPISGGAGYQVTKNLIDIALSQE